jgi:PPM family protein phosphatase
MLKKCYELFSYALCDPGLKRPNNEDFWAEAMDGRAYVVADGMGGHQAGEVASHLAVTHFSEQLDLLQGDEVEVQPFLKRALSLTNQYVWQRAQDLPDWKGMGTTLTAIVFLQSRAFFAHVGDSALFHLSDKRLVRLTQEHTKKVVQGQKERQVITRAVGVHSRVEPQVGSVSVKKGDRFLITSDGLTFYLSRDEIEQVLLLALDLQSCVETLFSMAMQRGGGDNITIILVEVGNELP